MRSRWLRIVRPKKINALPPSYMALTLPAEQVAVLEKEAREITSTQK
jgi:hypothetical protein